MGKLDDLAIKLEQIKKDEEKQKINMTERKKKWLQDLNDFFSNIKKWLKPLVDKNLVQINEMQLPISEDAFGDEYNVPFINIRLSNQTIQFKPIGAIIIGAKGRVDIIISSKINIMIVKHDDGWKIAIKNQRGYDYKDFNEDSFAEIIEELIK